MNRFPSVPSVPSFPRFPSFPNMDLHHSVHQIRRRLFVLLMQAFGAVVLLTVIILLGLAAVVVNNDQLRQIEVFSLSQPLQNYYAGRGSWAGVEVVLRNRPAAPFDSEHEWQRTLLLDNSGVVIIDKGRTDTARVGQTYTPAAKDRRMPLTLEGEQIGVLIIESGSRFFLSRYLGNLAAPVIFISFFTGALTLLIGFLLMRRVVTPLADVIGAAHAVATGDFSARVQVRGPDDLRSLSDSFNRMAEALERNDRERRNWLADIAHELRTPLTVIRGRLEGMVDGVYPADETHVAPVLEETYVLERLVEDLHLLTLAESRQLHFDKQPVQLGELVERAADLFRAEAEEKNIQLVVQVSADTPAVEADPQRVGQVIGNLLSNALRYAPENGRVTIDVDRADSAGRVRLAVGDNGPGVPEADLPKLFDRFWRSEKSRTRGAGGAGLGLAIARQLIEAQGGRLTAQNLPEGGLQVAFVL